MDLRAVANGGDGRRRVLAGLDQQHQQPFDRGQRPPRPAGDGLPPAGAIAVPGDRRRLRSSAASRRWSPTPASRTGGGRSPSSRAPAVRRRRPRSRRRFVTSTAEVGDEDAWVVPRNGFGDGAGHGGGGLQGRRAVAGGRRRRRVDNGRQAPRPDGERSGEHLARQRGDARFGARDVAGRRSGRGGDTAVARVLPDGTFCVDVPLVDGSNSLQVVSLAQGAMSAPRK